jgi:hypothetical protein
MIKHDNITKQHGYIFFEYSMDFPFYHINTYKPSTLRIAMVFFWGANPEKNWDRPLGGTSMVPIWILGEHPLVDFRSLIGAHFIEIKL